VETHSETLHSDLDTLTPLQRKVRLALEENLYGLPDTSRHDFVLRLRRMAEFMRLGRRGWHRVVDRLFTLDPERAEGVIHRYRAWLRTPRAGIPPDGGAPQSLRSARPAGGVPGYRGCKLPFSGPAAWSLATSAAPSARS
jgi:hypothetical protein